MTLQRLIPCLFLPGWLHGQIITGSLTGRVLDPSGAAIAGASLELTAASTGRSRASESQPSGEFTFHGLESGRYALVITAAGFSTFERQNIVLDSAQRLVVGEIVLQLGETSEKISVTAESGSVVALQSAERSDVITGRQTDGLLNLGRNITSLVQLVPGVVLVSSSNSFDRGMNFNVNGSRSSQNNISIDGLPAVDVGSATQLKLNVSQDSVAEVKILLSNYQAEYGRMAGSNVHVITKSGTREFHGLVSHFRRHEQFNANNFFNNQRGVARPRLRQNVWNYNIGGPVYVPGKFNRDRNKLFFFWGQEYWPTKSASQGNVTAPTALERHGDFSQSLDVNNRLIVVRDPSTRQPFPGNRMPASRLDASGVALLKLFPEPNFFDRSISRGAYNYLFTVATEQPRRTDTLKADYILGDRDQLVFGLNTLREFIRAPNPDANWPQWDRDRNLISTGFTARYTKVLSPALVNEAHVGWLYNWEYDDILPETIRRNTRAAAGYTAGQMFRNNNPRNLIPDATFGGVPSAATLAKDGRFPYTALINVVNVDEKLTWTRGSHSLKAGAYFEWFQRDIGEPVSFAGLIDFGRNVNNPLDTDYAYANAAIGVFNSYLESSRQPYPETRNILAEFFVQDNWRASRRLTFDYGVRLYHSPPIIDTNNQLAAFAPERYDRSQAVSLVQPYLNASGARVGRHPVTGAIYAAPLIGAIAPGTGDSANGMAIAGQREYPRGLTESPGLQVAPRAGFAYDVFGNGRTAVRGGFGVFYNRPNFGVWVRPYSAQPPVLEQPIINFSTLNSIGAATGFLFPTNVLGLDRNAKLPRVMNYSFSVQQNIGRGTVVDAGYVGSLGRHLLWRRDLNAIAAGANFSLVNTDPTIRGRALPPAFLRPITGYNSIDMAETASSSNYHSFQLTANRRFQRGVQFGLAWTWSKALDFVDTDTQSVSVLTPVRVWNYGLANFDRTHVLKVNWLWDLPSSSVRSGVLRQILNGWQMSGIASFVSGRPLSAGLTTTTALDITGTASQGARVDVTGNPVLPKSERTFSRNFRTEVFRLPAVGTFGNAAKTQFRGPGENNWDIAVFKDFPIVERLKLLESTDL